MKKIMSLCMMTIFILPLAACAGNSGQSNNTPVTPVSLQHLSQALTENESEHS